MSIVEYAYMRPVHVLSSHFVINLGSSVFEFKRFACLPSPFDP